MVTAPPIPPDGEAADPVGVLKVTVSLKGFGFGCKLNILATNEMGGKELGYYIWNFDWRRLGILIL